MKKVMIGIVVLVLMSSVVFADINYNPKEARAEKRQRFLESGQREYPVQQVTIMTYDRPNVNQVMKQRFLRPNVPVDPASLRVIRSVPGGWNKGKIFMTPYWKKSVYWAKEK